MVGEADDVADRRVDHEAFSVGKGIALAQARRDVGQRRGGIAAGAGEGEHLFVDVGGEDLYRQRRPGCLERLGKQHRDRIGFLAAGAAGHPHPQVLVGRAGLDERDDCAGAQDLEQLGIAEKAGDVDEQVAQQRLAFVGAGAQPGEVGAAGGDAQHMHPPLDPAHQRRALVTREIVAHRIAQHPAQIIDMVGDDFGLRGGTVVVIGAAVAARKKRAEAAEDLRRRLDEIDEPGAYCRERHAIVAGAFGLLHHADAAMLLDGAQPGGAIGAGARKDHAGGVGVLVGGERDEEIVDRPTQPAWLREIGEFQHAAAHRQPTAGGDDVGAVRLQPFAALALVHLDVGSAVEQLGHQALVGGIEVLDDDQRQPGGRVRGAQHFAQRLQPAGRGADADDRRHMRGGNPGFGVRLLHGRLATAARSWPENWLKRASFIGSALFPSARASGSAAGAFPR